MTPKEKILVIGALDEILLGTFGYESQLTNEERDEIAAKIKEVFDVNAPKELREALAGTIRILLEEVREGE